LLGREERRRRLLDELLVPALERAVASRDHHDSTLGVREALRLDMPGCIQILLDEALPRPKAAVASRTADSYDSTMSSACRTTLIPRPPPPWAALIAIGSPCSRTKRSTSAASSTGCSVPGTRGAPTRCASWRA